MHLRRWILRIHLCLGLFSGIFLVILGLTGSVIAFEGDIDHWMNPSRWFVHARGTPLAEERIIGGVEQQFAPLRVASIQISPRHDLAQVMQLSDRSTVTVDPYTATVLSHTKGPSRADRIVGAIHQFHLRLASGPSAWWGPVGKLLVSCAGACLCFLVPTGLFLWWRTKRLAIRRQRASWFRVLLDVHHVVGIYAGLFLWIAAFTGVLIGFEFPEKAIYAWTASARPTRIVTPPSAPPPHSTSRISVDQAMESARRAMPSAFLEGITLPLDSTSSFSFLMRVREETSGIPHSAVAMDQYTGQVLAVHNFLTDSQGYRWIRFNRSIHTGDAWGTPGHVIMSLSSLLLVAMVLTGVVIWWKKLA